MAEPLSGQLRQKIKDGLTGTNLNQFGMEGLLAKVIADVVVDSIQSDLERLEIAEEIMASEQFMWLMCGSNHSESHLRSLRPAWDKWIEKGGAAWGKK